MKFDIPTLYQNSAKQIDKPNRGYYGYYGDSGKYDQYALLDRIEFIGQNIRDIRVTRFHIDTPNKPCAF